MAKSNMTPNQLDWAPSNSRRAKPPITNTMVPSANTLRAYTSNSLRRVNAALPATATTAVGARGFGVYVHVPFCASRCGYCDFNTYTASELGGGASREGYADTVLAELALAARVLGDSPPPRVDTVFVGGGTPTVMCMSLAPFSIMARSRFCPAAG